MDRSALISELKTMLVEELNLRRVTPADVEDDGRLFGPEGLGLDSLDALQFGAAVEQRYALKLPWDTDEELRMSLASIAALADFILLARRGA